jgi:hypothetical protein
MSSQDLYRFLVPDAPIHRRTEADPYQEKAAVRSHARSAAAAPAPTPALDHPSLVSSWAGAIEHVLLAVPSYGVDDPRLAQGYRSVIAALRVGTDFAVVVHESRRAEVEEWFASAGHEPANVTLVPMPDYVSFTDWAEDGYVALLDTADGSRFLVEPWEFPRAGDALIADAVEQRTEITAAQAPLIFQGGNCLIGPDFWLLGADYFADTLDLLESPRPPVVAPDGVSLDEFARRLFGDYVEADRELRLIGTRRPIPIRPFYGRREGADYFLDLADGGAGTFQPIFHIDMFITLVGEIDGRFTVLVADPSLAGDVVGGDAPYALQDVYDQIARDLAARGMRVVRNPLVHHASAGQRLPLRVLRREAADDASLLLAVQELEAAGARDGTPITVRDWHHITWNNCLVENTTAHGGPHVYLPTFGHGEQARLAAIDERMAELWNELGFTVHRLGDFNEFARRQGVVHCIKKYLRRSAT